MKHACTTTLGLLLCLAACGSETPAGQRITAAPPEPAASVVILDPAGRLLDQGEPPKLYRIDDGVPVRVHAWRESPVVELDTPLTTNTELLVVARGCKPMRVSLAPGRNVVRLEAGFRVRVSIAGSPPTLPEGATLGLSLSRRMQTVAGVDLPGGLALAAIAAEAFDDDAPTHPQYITIPRGRSFEVLVPIPGPYILAWDVRAGNRASSTKDPRSPHVLESGMGALDVLWANAAIERMVKLMQRGR